MVISESRTNRKLSVYRRKQMLAGFVSEVHTHTEDYYAIVISGVVVLDAGHFALDTKAAEIAALVCEFMKTQK